MFRDQRLAARCRRGDREAFCQVYDAHVDALLGLAVALLGDTGLAEDVVQDVFVGFARSAATFRLTGSFRAYLATCTANRARDVIRRRQRRPEAVLPDSDPVDTGGKGPLETAMEKEQSEHVRAALARLPCEQREAIVLRLHGQMKFNQIAAVQEVSLSTVRSRYRYGLERLRTLLERVEQRGV